MQIGSAPTSPASRPTPVKKFWPMRDLPSYIWLVATALVALGHRNLPEPRWLLIHLVLLGAVSHAILVWSQHFSYALLHVPASARELKEQNLRLIGFNAGVVIVIVGVLSVHWPVTMIGAILIALAVIWHAVSFLMRFRKALGVRFGVTIWYYVVASAVLPIGATLGVLLAHGFADPTHGQVKVSHALLNVLGWVGLTVLGTLVTLWPTMLRTKMRPESVTAAQRTLWVFVAALAATALGAGFGLVWAAAAGIVGYLTGVVWLGVVFVRTAAQRPPAAFCTLSVAAGFGWLVGTLTYLAVGFIRGAVDGSWDLAYESFTHIAPFLAAGFAAQVLLGALSYLIPVMISQGPASSRAANTEMDRGGVFRVVTANIALIISVLPVPSVVLVLATMLYLGSAASFLILMIRSMRAARSAKAPTATELTSVGAASEVKARNPYGDKPRGWFLSQTVAAVVASMLVVAVGVAVNPAALGSLALGNTSAGTGGGHTDAEIAAAPRKTITIEARDMRFTPASVDVPRGTNLTIKLTNTDTSNVHDLVFENGLTSGRLAPGDSATIEVGILDDSLDGWCSILGHKQMGMVFRLNATGTVQADGEGTGTGGDSGTQAGSSGSDDGAGDMGDMGSDDMGNMPGHDMSGSTGVTSAAADLDFMASPSDDFMAHDARLEPLPTNHGPVTHTLTMEITEEEREVAPGVTQLMWLYNGQFPGPTLHGRVGDTFDITLVNKGTMGHSIDFHASNLAPDEPMRTIAPGESLQYTFTASRAGIWMYHCSTMPMTAHIANGMAGAVVIEPDDLPPVDESYLLVQSEMYLGPQGGPVDVDKAMGGDSNLDLVAFNGYANQYVAQPLTAKVGERVRIWTLDVGPSRASSFHVVGGQFDRVWFEGQYTLGSAKAVADGRDGGSQALAMQPAQGGFVELTFPEAGHYPFVTHIMADAERGAKGIFAVTN